MGAGGVCTIWLTWKDTQDLMRYVIWYLRYLIFTYVYIYVYDVIDKFVQSLYMYIPICGINSLMLRTVRQQTFGAYTDLLCMKSPSKGKLQLDIFWNVTCSQCPSAPWPKQRHAKNINIMESWIIILTVWRHLLEISNSQHLQPRLTSTTSQTQTFLRPTDWANVSAG